MSAYRLSDEARQDLIDVWNYVAKDSLDKADRLLDELHEAMKKLAEMPGLGGEHDYNDDTSFRVWPVHSYLIIYKLKTQPLQIFRVVSGHRDIKRIRL